MNITLTGKQVDIGDRLRKHVEEAIENSVTKYFSAPLSCTVAFSKEGEEFSAEVTVHPAKNMVLKGSGLAGDPYSAFDNANEHIATRLRRNKNKLNDHKSKIGLAELAIRLSCLFMKQKMNLMLTLTLLSRLPKQMPIFRFAP